MERPAPAVGCRVRIVTGKLADATAVVRFRGPTHFQDGEWVGLELAAAVGRNDGAVDDVRYFACPAKHGVFLRPEHVQVLPDPPAAGSALPAPPRPGSKASAIPTCPARPSKSPQLAATRLTAEPAPRRSSPAAALARDPPAAPLSPDLPAPALSSEPPAVTVSANPPAAMDLEDSGTPATDPEDSGTPAAEDTPENAEPADRQPDPEELAVREGSGPVAATPPTAQESPVLQLVPRPLPGPDSSRRHSFGSEAGPDTQSPASRIPGLPGASPPDAPAVPLLRNLMAQTHSLQQQVEAKGQQLTARSTECGELRARVRALATQLQDAQADLAEMAAEMEVLRVDKDLAEEEKELLQEQVWQLQQEMEAASGPPGPGSAGGNGALDGMGEAQLRAELREHQRLLQLLRGTLAQREASLEEAKALCRELLPLRERARHQAESIADLKERLEAALSAEDTVEQLTERNLLLEDHVANLRQEVLSLIEYRDLSQEIEAAHQEDLYRLNEEVNAKEVLLAEQRRMVQAQQKVVQDREAALRALRERLDALQEELLATRLTAAGAESSTQARQAEAQQQLEWAVRQKARGKRIADRLLEHARHCEGALFPTWLQAYLPPALTQSDVPALQTLLLLQGLAFKAETAALAARELAEDAVHEEPSESGPRVTLSDGAGHGHLALAGDSELLAATAHFLLARLDAALQAADPEALLQCATARPTLAAIGTQLDSLLQRQREGTLDGEGLGRLLHSLVPPLNALWRGEALPAPQGSKAAVEAPAVPWAALGPFLGVGLAAAQAARAQLLAVRHLLLRHTSAGPAAGGGDGELTATQQYVHVGGQLLSWVDGMAQKLRAAQKEVAGLSNPPCSPATDDSGLPGVPGELFHALLRSFGTLAQWGHRLQLSLTALQQQVPRVVADPSLPLHSPEVQDALRHALTDRAPPFALPHTVALPLPEAVGGAAFCLMAVFADEGHGSPHAEGTDLFVAEHLQVALKHLVTLLNALRKAAGGEGPAGPTARERRARAVQDRLGSVDRLEGEVQALRAAVERQSATVSEAEARAAAMAAQADQLEALQSALQGKEQQLQQLQLQLEDQAQEGGQLLQRLRAAHAEALGQLEAQVAGLAEDRRALLERLQGAEGGKGRGRDGRPLSRAASPMLVSRQEAGEDSVELSRRDQEIRRLQAALKFAKLRALVPYQVERKLLLLDPAAGGGSVPGGRQQQEEARMLATACRNELHSLRKAAGALRSCHVVDLSGEDPTASVAEWKRGRFEMRALEAKSQELRDKLALLASQLQRSS